MLTRIFPFTSASRPESCLNLVIAAEGFLAGDAAEFHRLCADFVDSLLATAPFNMTRRNSGWITIWSAFGSSTSRGAFAGISAPAGRSVFGAAVSGGMLILDQALFDSWAAGEQLRDHGTTRDLTEIFKPGISFSRNTGTLVLVLLPQAGGAGVEAQNLPADDQFGYLATSADGLWEQFVLRALASKLGLGDEFERTGADFLEPIDVNSQIQLSNHFNLYYSDTPPLSLNQPSLPWFTLFSSIQRIAAPTVHPRSGDPAVVDNGLDAFPATSVKVEFWEGGGGYRRKVYRSSRDCLMRRKVADPALPIRTAPVPLCVACRHFISNTIG